MLSTQYRLRLEGICNKIANGADVPLEDMIWANKLSKANTTARGMLCLLWIIYLPKSYPLKERQHRLQFYCRYLQDANDIVLIT